ncbi:MAG: hypothetical protein RXP77_03175 [Nitrososphaeria archaeon]
MAGSEVRSSVREQPTIVCRCMDKTQEDLIKSLQMAIRMFGPEALEFENYRRLATATTGFCQGRGCLSLVQRVFASEMKKMGVEFGMDEIQFRVRSPLQPVPLGLFARRSLEEV